MRRLKPYRILVQMVFLFASMFGFFFSTTGLIYPYFFCYSNPYNVGACPIGIIEHSFMDMRTPDANPLPMLLYVLGFLSVVGFLVGRSFCGWACPIGSLQDVIWWARIKTGIGGVSEKKAIANRAGIFGSGSVLRYVKYGILVLIPVTSFATASLLYTDWEPVGFITGTIMQLALDPDSFELTVSGWVKLVLTIGMVGLSFGIASAWCRFLCPIGAHMGLHNKIAVVQVSCRDKGACTSCGLCARTCRMGVDPSRQRRSPECTLCGRCVDACPTSCLSLGMGSGPEKDAAEKDADFSLDGSQDVVEGETSDSQPGESVPEDSSGEAATDAMEHGEAGEQAGQQAGDQIGEQIGESIDSDGMYDPEAVKQGGTGFRSRFSK